FVEPFFSTKPRHRGLGLPIVFGILRSFQGGFRIDAGPIGGTQVRLYLPSAARPAAPVPEEARPASVQGDRMLVVDDDPMVLRLVCATLEQSGFRAAATTSGAEALTTYTAAGEDQFGLVLADVLMPEMNGIELARRLLRLDPSVNLLFMSGQVLSDLDQADF